MSRLTLRGLLAFWLFCSMALPAAGQDAPGEQRPYRIDDNFSTEVIHEGSVTVAPDGQAVAWTQLRPANTQLTNSLLIAETRGDIWLQEAPGLRARNLTNGHVDSSGWWDPQWSPDGQRLAFLSSRGGEVTVWAWERERDDVRQLSAVGVDFSEPGRCRWVDARRLLCLAVPDGERSTPTQYYGMAVERAEAAWAKAKRGELTASVVNSLEFKLPLRRLVLVDVSSGTSQTLATTQLLDMEYGFAPSWWLSLAGQGAAFVRPETATLELRQRALTGRPTSIELRRLDGKPLRLKQPLPTNVVTSTLQWSPDGQALAFFALGDALLHPEVLYGGPESAREVRYPSVASKEYPGKLWRVDLARNVVERIPTGDIDLGQGLTPPAFQWTASGELLFRAPRLVEGSRPLRGAEPEWLVLGRDGRTRGLAAEGQELPEELEAIEGGAAFLGLLDGEVWRVEAEKGTLKRLMRVDSVGVDVQPIEGAEPTTHAIVSWLGTPRTEAEKAVVSGTLLRNYPQWFGMGHLVNYALLDLKTGANTPLRKPVPSAELVTYDGGSQSAFWLANDRAGTFLWRRRGTAPSESLVATNTFWKDVAKGQQRMIEYTTLNGESMKAKLVLPIGYQPGRRYPLVVDFDIGYSPETGVPPLPGPSTLPKAYEEEFAAAGYVYMFASWPSTSMDQIGRANLLLGPNGIIPAVEKAIALGIADPERLFLYGLSSAGYGVFALVTQSSRFKAAAAHAGWVDNIMQRLTTTIMDRYTENPFDFAPLGGANYIPSSLPFWRNGENYRRNSPLSYVDRVQTPLLILHGDLDVVPITEPEVFFKALVMQRKPAQFVRYWGEGHGNETPVNFRDYFQRIFAWFDQWGDIARDAEGNMVFDGDRVKSREGAPPLPAEEYAKFPLFGPGGAAAMEASVEH